jgi:hypothetical protein
LIDIERLIDIAEFDGAYLGLDPFQLKAPQDASRVAMFGR